MKSWLMDMHCSAKNVVHVLSFILLEIFELYTYIEKNKVRESAQRRPQYCSSILFVGLYEMGHIA